MFLLQLLLLSCYLPFSATELSQVLSDFQSWCEIFDFSFYDRLKVEADFRNFVSNSPFVSMLNQDIQDHAVMVCMVRR